jgi:hypothetical protein
MASPLFIPSSNQKHGITTQYLQSDGNRVKLDATWDSYIKTYNSLPGNTEAKSAMDSLRAPIPSPYSNMTSADPVPWTPHNNHSEA